MSPHDCEKMIQNIKEEQRQILANQISPDFQYAGKWCFYSYDQGHNCTTWAEEKLDIIGLGQWKISDSSKAMPSMHTYCSIL